MSTLFRRDAASPRRAVPPLEVFCAVLLARQNSNWLLSFLASRDLVHADCCLIFTLWWGRSSRMDAALIISICSQCKPQDFWPVPAAVSTSNLTRKAAFPFESMHMSGTDGLSFIAALLPIFPRPA